MSPRRADPQTAVALLEAAAKLLAEGGPGALSTRKLATMVGTSTTAVYTHFRGMDGLVRAMVHEGFARLHQRLGLVASTDDPVADVITLGNAYRENARRNPDLYAVMFGGAVVEGFALTDEDRKHGRYTLEFLVDAVQRSVAAGRFRDSDPQLVAQQMWIALHGLVTLELGGYLFDPYDADTCYDGQLCALLVGAGDRPAEVAESMVTARRRYSQLYAKPVGTR